MKQLRTLIAVAIILFLPLAAQAQKVNVDFDKAIDFSKFKTFMWAMGHRWPTRWRTSGSLRELKHNWLQRGYRRWRLTRILR